MKKLFLLSILALGCTDGYYTDRDYPRLGVPQVGSVTSLSAFVSAEIFHSSVPMTDHGFLISPDNFPDIDEGTKVSFGPRSEIGTFSHTFQFIPGEKMYIRAYVISPGHTVYSSVTVDP